MAGLGGGNTRKKLGFIHSNCSWEVRGDKVTGSVVQAMPATSLEKHYYAQFDLSDYIADIPLFWSEGKPATL
jgi:hypothetical protein